MAEVSKQKNNEYGVLLNEEGEVLFAIRARLDGAQQPRMLYDGGDCAVFYRSKEHIIYLENLIAMVRKPLSQIKQVLFVEVFENAIVREYIVPVSFVDKMPPIA